MHIFGSDNWNFPKSRVGFFLVCCREAEVHTDPFSALSVVIKVRDKAEINQKHLTLRPFVQKLVCHICITYLTWNCSNNMSKRTCTFCVSEADTRCFWLSRKELFTDVTSLNLSIVLMPRILQIGSFYQGWNFVQRIFKHESVSPQHF